jgi:hypothetical protein
MNAMILASAIAMAAPPSDAIDETERTGAGLLIGAGALALAGTGANAMRAMVVSGPCQTESQSGCGGKWFVASTFAWSSNAVAISLAGVGGAMLGRAAATRGDRERRRRALVIAGPVLMGVGALGSIAVRTLWLSDWASPGGYAFFDFAHRGDAFLYYGALQASSLVFAAGLAATTYATARPIARRRVSISPMLGRQLGLSISGRF